MLSAVLLAAVIVAPFTNPERAAPEPQRFYSGVIETPPSDPICQGTGGGGCDGAAMNQCVLACFTDHCSSASCPGTCALVNVGCAISDTCTVLCDCVCTPVMPSGPGTGVGRSRAKYLECRVGEDSSAQVPGTVQDLGVFGPVK